MNKLKHIIRINQLKYICIEKILEYNLNYSKIDENCKDRINDVIQFKKNIGDFCKNETKMKQIIENEDIEFLDYVLKYYYDQYIIILRNNGIFPEKYNNNIKKYILLLYFLKNIIISKNTYYQYKINTSL
jgi:hypothetical protein